MTQTIQTIYSQTASSRCTEKEDKRKVCFTNVYFAAVGPPGAAAQPDSLDHKFCLS